MSGPQIVLVAAVGVLALVALIGVGALLAQVRALRRQLAESTASGELAATPAPSAPPDPPAPAVPAVPAVPLVPAVQPQASRSYDLDGTGLLPVRAPTSGQIVLATTGHPLVRAAAIAHGLRQAMRPENRDRISALMQRDLRRREKLRRQAARRAARALPTESGASSQQRRDQPS